MRNAQISHRGKMLIGLMAAVIMLGNVGEAMAAKGYRLKKSKFSSLAGWDADNHAEAFAVFRRSCAHKLSNGRSRGAHGLNGVCRLALSGPAALPRPLAKRFFERHFTPYLIIARGTSKGLFTGYFEPEYKGARKKGPGYAAPVLPAPENLVALPAGKGPRGFPSGLTAALQSDKGLKPVPTRGQIENGALKKLIQPIAWLADPVDAFFLHIQGSGRIRLPDGGTMRLAFAGRNGHPYSSIGLKLLKDGILKKNQLSMQSVQAWLRGNPKRARKILQGNKSYIFFREIELDDELGPIGADGVPLTAGRSLAVDRRYHRYGLPLWLDTRIPGEGGRKTRKYRRLMIAQDTGAAIRGAVRGDIFFGTGDAAGEVAGRVKEAGRLYMLLPKTVNRKR